MPDIAMCSGKDCPLKENCYRHNATPTPNWQSYFCKPPNEGIACEYYWPEDEKWQLGSSQTPTSTTATSSSTADDPKTTMSECGQPSKKVSKKKTL